MAKTLGFEEQKYPGSVEEMLGLIHPEDKADGRIIAFIEGRSPHYYGELRLKTGKGEWKWVHMHGRIVRRDKRGEPLQALGIVQDISKHKETEKKLSRERFKARTLFQNMDIGVSFYQAVDEGRDFILLDMNKKGIELDDYNREEIIGRSVFEVIPEVKQSGFLKMMQKVYQTGITLKYPPTKYLSPEGKYVWREGYLYKMPTGEVVTVYSDQMEREETREELDLVQNRLEVIFESIDEGIIVFDRELNIVLANSVAKNLLALSGDLFGKRLHEVLPKNKVMIWENALQSVLGKKKEISLYSDHLTARGSRFYQLRLVPELDRDDKVKYVMTIFHDLTDYRRVKKELLERRKQLEQSRMKARFLADLSHDFKTPLTLILSSLQMLAHYRKKGSYESLDKVEKYLKIIKQNSYRLLRLVNNLLDLTKMESNTFTLSLCNVDIVKLVKRITYSVEDFIVSGGRVLQFNSQVEEKITACDPVSFERIILNLLSNAVKFTEEGDTITVNILDKKESVVITVRDTGIGIREEHREQIFKEYCQVHEQMLRKRGGTGLGLSIVKLLVEMHGGTISVRSKYGEGSEFIVELPVRLLPEDEPSLINDDLEESLNELNELLELEFADLYGLDC